MTAECMRCGRLFGGRALRAHRCPHGRICLARKPVPSFKRPVRVRPSVPRCAECFASRQLALPGVA